MGLQETAARLIALNGRQVTHRVKSLTPEDPAAPWDANTTTTPTVVEGFQTVDDESRFVGDREIVAVIVGYDSREIDGSLVLAKDRKALISPLVAATITEKDEIIDGGVRYSIIKCDPVKPGNVNYLWKLQLRS